MQFLNNVLNFNAISSNLYLNYQNSNDSEYNLINDTTTNNNLLIMKKENDYENNEISLIINSNINSNHDKDENKRKRKIKKSNSEGINF